MSNEWIYEKVSHERSPRFVLGERGKRPLVCFGINPSTAVPEKLDRTLANVRNHSIKHGFDGWIMLNVYPERATIFNDLTKNCNTGLHQKNIYWIKNVFSEHPKATVWAAWGGLIDKRGFLKDCLSDIVANTPRTVRWFRRGSLVGGKHPHHPLYLKRDSGFEAFDIHHYVKAFEE